MGERPTIINVLTKFGAIPKELLTVRIRVEFAWKVIAKFCAALPYAKIVLSDVENPGRSIETISPGRMGLFKEKTNETFFGKIEELV